MQKTIKKEFFNQKASIVAPKMPSLVLFTKQCAAVLYEVEAYEGKNDPASHAYRLTSRSRIMHETFAHWYVYFIYGNHHCLNITCSAKEAGAVLIREAIPIRGLGLMKKRRGTSEAAKLCNGPGKICQAFGIDKTWNGMALGEKLSLRKMNSQDKRLLRKYLGRNIKQIGKNRKVLLPKKIIALPRVGISKAKGLKWRFRLA